MLKKKKKMKKRKGLIILIMGNKNKFNRSLPSIQPEKSILWQSGSKNALMKRTYCNKSKNRVIKTLPMFSDTFFLLSLKKKQLCLVEIWSKSRHLLFYISKTEDNISPNNVPLYKVIHKYNAIVRCILFNNIIIQNITTL